MIDVTLENFETEVIAASHQVPVLVDFWAPWCGPCKTLGPLLEKVEADYGGRFKLVKINSDDEQQLAQAQGEMTAWAAQALNCKQALRLLIRAITDRLSDPLRDDDESGKRVLADISQARPVIADMINERISRATATQGTTANVRSTNAANAASTTP